MQAIPSTAAVTALHALLTADALLGAASGVLRVQQCGDSAGASDSCREPDGRGQVQVCAAAGLQAQHHLLEATNLELDLVGGVGPSIDRQLLHKDLDWPSQLLPQRCQHDPAAAVGGHALPAELRSCDDSQ